MRQTSFVPRMHPAIFWDVRGPIYTFTSTVNSPISIVGMEIMFIVIGMLAIPILTLTYMRLNARMDELDRRTDVTSGGEIDGEKFNEEAKFRYTL